MRLDQIKVKMRVWVINPYGRERKVAKVVGVGVVVANNRKLRFVELTEKRGRRWYSLARWARDLRLTKCGK